LQMSGGASTKMVSSQSSASISMVSESVSKPRVGLAIVNSQDQLLVYSTAETLRWEVPARLVGDSNSATLLAAAASIAQTLDLVVGEHIVSVAVSRRVAGGSASDALHWVLCIACDAIFDTSPGHLVSAASLGASGLGWRHFQHVIEEASADSRAGYVAFAQWATPILHRRAQLARSIADLSGRWSRDSSQNNGVVAALLARGLTHEEAKAEAERPYVQSWERCPNGEGAPSDAWKVVTFDTHQLTNDGRPTPHRTLIYPLGDWQEEYLGKSTLYGTFTTPSLLLRSTRWLARPHPTNLGAATTDRADAFGTEVEAMELLSASSVAHTTWSSRHNHTSEITSRYLRGPHLVVRRTWLPRDEESGALLPGVAPIVCEEVFVRSEEQGEGIREGMRAAHHALPARHEMATRKHRREEGAAREGGKQVRAERQRLSAM